MQQHECAMSWKAHCGEVCSVEFSCDENAVYSIGEDGKVGAAGLRAGAPLPPAGLSESRELDIVGRVQILAMPLVSSDFGPLSASALSSVK